MFIFEIYFLLIILSLSFCEFYLKELLIRYFSFHIGERWFNYFLVIHYSNYFLTIIMLSLFYLFALIVFFLPLKLIISNLFSISHLFISIALLKFESFKPSFSYFYYFLQSKNLNFISFPLCYLALSNQKAIFIKS